jgi:hypothetical protein
MLRRIPKLLMLVALLAAFAASSIPVFGNSGCQCNVFFKGGGHQGGCQFDKKTSQCVNTGCKGECF